MHYLNQQIEQRYERLSEQFMALFSERQFIDLANRMKNAQTPERQAAVYNDAVQYLQEITVKNQDAMDSVLLMGLNENVYSDQYKPRFTYYEFTQTSYYQSAMRNKNKMLYIHPNDPAQPPAIVRSFYYTGNNDVGYEATSDNAYQVLVFFLRDPYLEQVLDQVSISRQVKALMLDDNANVIAQSRDRNDLGAEAVASLDDYPIEGDSGEFRFRLEDHRYSISYDTFSFADWKLLYMYDEEILYKDAGKSTRILFIVMAVSLVLVVLIGHLIARTVTRPLKRLQETMEKTKEGNLDVNVIPRSRDEIAFLYQHFNRMMSRIQELVERIKSEERQKREGELRALQAQINPHFLYNTLDTIYWKLKMSKHDELADLVADLGMFFRLSLNKGQEITTVKNEIEHVVKYMNIQMVRYSNKFDYDIQVDIRMMGHKIPKLILQPLAENSILHGFLNKAQDGLIVIRGQVEGDTFQLIVEDNGGGIPEEILDKLPGHRHRDRSDTGYALRNVDERIELYAGYPYGLIIDNRPEGGTKATVTLPCDLPIKDRRGESADD